MERPGSGAEVMHLLSDSFIQRRKDVHAIQFFKSNSIHFNPIRLLRFRRRRYVYLINSKQKRNLNGYPFVNR